MPTNMTDVNTTISTTCEPQRGAHSGLTHPTPTTHLKSSEEIVPYSAVKYGAYFRAYFGGLFPVQNPGLIGGCKTLSKTLPKTLPKIPPYILRIYTWEIPTEIPTQNPTQNHS